MCVGGGVGVCVSVVVLVCEWVCVCCVSGEKVLSFYLCVCVLIFFASEAIKD